MEDLLTLKEAAPKIGWKEGTIYNRISKGNMPLQFIKLPGGGIRFTKVAIEKYLQKRTINQTS